MAYTVLPIRLVFTMRINVKAMPTNDTDYSCYRTCLTNQSYGVHIMPLALVARAHARTRTDHVCTESILRNQAHASQKLARACFN